MYKSQSGKKGCWGIIDSFGDNSSVEMATNELAKGRVVFIFCWNAKSGVKDALAAFRTESFPSLKSWQHLSRTSIHPETRLHESLD